MMGIGLMNQDKSKQLKRMPSSAALLGRAEEEEEPDDFSAAENLHPFEMVALKARAFRISQKERKEEMGISENNDKEKEMTGKKKTKSKQKPKGVK